MRNKKVNIGIIGLGYLGPHHYEKFNRPSEIDGWARRCGLSVASMIGMSYNPLTKQYKLEDDVSVNYIVHYKKK